MPTPLNIKYQYLIDLIGEAKTEQVLEDLATALKDQPAYAAYNKEVTLLSNNFSQLQRAKRIDVIGFQNYTTKSNQINNALLEILEDLKEGKAYHSHNVESISFTGFWKIASILAILLLGILGGIGAASYFFFFNKEEKIEWECPAYNSPSFKVLVLPFHNELPTGRTAPHKHIVSRLTAFSKEENLAVHIGTIQPDGAINAIYDEAEAEEYIQECKPDMLVWGQADILDATTGITVHYSLKDPIQFEWLTDFETDGKIDTVLQDALTSASFEGATEQIEEVLERILKVTVAFKEKNYSAIAKLPASGLTETTMAVEKAITLNMQYIEAESYKNENEPEKAIATYSKILAAEPTATLALNNRAHLQYKQKQWDEALADFNTLETLDAANPEIIFKKATIHETLGNLGAAKTDYSRAEKGCPPRMKKPIKENIQRVEKKIATEKDKNSRRRGTTPTNSSVPRPVRPQISKDASVESLLEQAIINNRIGANKEAEAKAIAILEKDSKNKKAIKELIKAKYFQDNSIDLSDLKKDPNLRKIDSMTLKKLKDPVLEAVLRNGIAKRSKR